MVFGKLKNNSGISLLEVMVGMIVMAIGLLGLAPMLVLSMDGNSIARDNNIVSNLIKEKIEEYESVHPDSLPAVPFIEYETQCTLPGADPQQVSRNYIYSRITTLRDKTVNVAVPDGVYELQVDIHWTDNKNVQRVTTYKTYLLKS